MGLHIDLSSRPRDGRMIRRTLILRNPHVLPNGQRISRPPRHPALAPYALEVAHQQQPKIDPWRQPRAPHGRRLETLAVPFHESIKIVFAEHLIQTLVKGMALGSSQCAGRNPKLLLMFLPRSHRHQAILQLNIFKANCFRLSPRSARFAVQPAQSLDTRGGDLLFAVPQDEKNRFARRIAYLKELSKLSPVRSCRERRWCCKRILSGPTLRDDGIAGNPQNPKAGRRGPEALWQQRIRRCLHPR